MSKPNGFSLLEMMVALAVVSILAMLAVPTFRAPVERVERTQAAGCLLRLAGSLERHLAQTGSYSEFVVNGSGHACVERLANTYGFDILGLPDGDWSVVASDHSHWRLRARRLDNTSGSMTGPERRCAALTLESHGLQGVLDAGGRPVSDAGIIRHCWH